MKSVTADIGRVGSALGKDDLYRLSVRQYHRMTKSGILKDDPVELLEGLLFLKHPPAGAVEEDQLYRLSVQQYHDMIRPGILEEGMPVELLEGLLVRQMTKNPPHAVATRLTRTALDRLVPSGWFVDSQEPVTTDDSEPEPDVSVVRGKIRDYVHRHPRPKDSAMIVEVADSSLRRDRTTKKRIYARARVPVYWIINLIDRQIEVYSRPLSKSSRPDYRDKQMYAEDEEVPVIIDGVEVGRLAVRDLLP
jgi:Uma2 family endonuclease